MSYRGSGYYKRERRWVLYALVASVVILLVFLAVFLYEESKVYTSEDSKAVLPWTSESSEYTPDDDDGEEPIIEIEPPPMEN